MHTCMLQATIHVTDKNEFPPRFSRSTYKLENVYENITIGSSLITGRYFFPQNGELAF